MKTSLTINRVMLQNSKRSKSKYKLHHNSLSVDLVLVCRLRCWLNKTKETKEKIISFYYETCNAAMKWPGSLRLHSKRPIQESSGSNLHWTTSNQTLAKWFSCCNNSLCCNAILLVYFPCRSTCPEFVNPYWLPSASDNPCPPKCRSRFDANPSWYSCR